MRCASRVGGLIALVALSCAGELEGDEASYRVSRGCGAGCGDVPALLAGRCGQNFCHGGEDLAEGLDLRSAGVESRLVGVSAKSDGCTSRKLVSPSASDESFLLEKITSPIPECGDPMPVVGELSGDERACIQCWIAGLSGGGDAAAPPVAPDAGDGGS